MRKKLKIYLFCAVLLILFGGTVSHAAISKPKNFRVVYVSDAGKELEQFEYSVYAVQQVFLDKLNISTYIDPKGYEYTVSGYRLKTWPGSNYSGKASDEKTMNYNGVVSALRSAYDTLDPPYSLQASVVLHATGNRYAILIPVHIVWLNQNDEFVKQFDEELGRDGIYTDKPPADYEVISVKAYMTDIWKIGSEISVDKKAPTVKYNKFAEEYRIVYRLNLTQEEEEEIMGITSSVADETDPSASEMPSGSTEPAPESSGETAEESTVPPQTSAAGSSDSFTDPAATETVAPPTQTDESYSNGSRNITLILGLVIGIAVIYLIVISIGTSSRGKPKKKKNRL